jgi:hemoglobin
MKTSRIILAAVAVMSLTTSLNAADTKSLFERLGGMPAIQAVASDLVDRILVDQRVNKWFTHAAASPENTRQYKAKLADFLCQNTGGPCQYAGRDMVTAHTGRGVTSDAFNAVVQDLTGSLDKFKVPQKEKTDVLAIVATLKSSIVQK